MRDALREIGKDYGLEADDITSAIMGTSGCDILFSPSARKLMDFDIEVKNVESLNVYTTFHKHFEKYAHRVKTLKLLFHKKNNKKMLVTFAFDDFVRMLRELLAYRRSLPAESGGAGGKG